MTDANVNSPVQPDGQGTQAAVRRRRLGLLTRPPPRAADAAARKAAVDDLDEKIPLKRQWDAGLEAELEAALSGFDPATFEVASARAQELRARGRRRPGAAARRAGRECAPARSSACAATASSSTWGARARGSWRANQFEGDLPAPGSSIEVVVERFDPEEGVQILRLKGSAIEADWDNLRKGVIVEARVTKTIKGGLEVDVDGIRGFLPISQIDLTRVDDASSYVNQKFKALVTEANARAKNLVVSRRDFLEQERAELRARTWATLEEGQVKDGVVRSIKGFGAFVDVGGVDGLLPIGEMSWSRDQQGRRALEDRRPDQGEGPEDRPHRPEAHAGLEAAHAQSLGPGRREVSPRPDGQGRGDADHGFRRLRSARARRRGLDPRLRAVAQPRAPGRRHRQGRPGGRGPRAQGRS